jgi:hypothetical protein
MGSPVGAVEEPDVLRLAREYERLGFATLPLHGKKPATELIRTTHGSPSTKVLAARGNDEEHLRFWFSSAGVNIGIFCGEPSGGLVVVDLDDCDFPPPGARLPLTPTVKTGRARSRGYHLYYRTSAPVKTTRFEWGEVRANANHYVTAPPSLHPDTGRAYGWQLPLAELPLADFTGVDLPERVLETRSRNLNNNNKQIRPTKAVLLGPPTTGDTVSEGWLQSLDADPSVVEAMAAVLGIDAPLGHPFRCVIHPDRNASAALRPADGTGHWLYHDFHAARHGAAPWLTLAHVRAARAGRTSKLAAPEHATWKLILLAEAGVISPCAVPALPLTPYASAIARHVYERFLFLLACRWNHTHGQPAAFDRRFAGCVCQISEREAREAIDELKRIEAIWIAGHHHRTRLWLPAGIGWNERTAA